MQKTKQNKQLFEGTRDKASQTRDFLKHKINNMMFTRDIFKIKVPKDYKLEV